MLLALSFGNELIAILDFEPINVSDEESRILSQRLISEMVNLDVYKVIETQEMKKILESSSSTPRDWLCESTNFKCAVDIGRMLGAKFVVTGSIGLFGETYSIDSRLVNVKTSESHSSASFSSTGSIDKLLNRGIKSIAKQLCDMDDTISNINIKPTKILDKDAFNYQTDQEALDSLNKVYGIDNHINVSDNSTNATVGVHVCTDRVEVCLSLNGANLNYNSTKDIAGFQFTHNGCLTLPYAQGGDAVANGFTVSPTHLHILGFSLPGTVIPAGIGTLVELNGDVTEDCLFDFIFVDKDGESLHVGFAK